MSEPDAFVRSISLPPMPAHERVSAARHEAERYTSDDEAFAVRLFPLDGSSRFALALARRTAMQTCLRIIRSAGLRCRAIDNAAFAFARLTSHGEGVLDVGMRGATLYVFDEDIPFVQHFPTGGSQITEGIAESLGIDSTVAEERKRLYGLAGSDGRSVTALLSALSSAIVAARTRGLTIDRLLLAGNGARLHGFAAAVARATAIPAHPITTRTISCSTLPADVVKAEFPDWSLAVGLALREAA
jgi:Tfp pilus assembly PilM family ATPase